MIRFKYKVDRDNFLKFYDNNLLPEDNFLNLLYPGISLADDNPQVPVIEFQLTKIDPISYGIEGIGIYPTGTTCIIRNTLTYLYKNGLHIYISKEEADALGVISNNGNGTGHTHISDLQLAINELYDKLCKVCECGKEKHGFARHSTWCDLYEPLN